MADADMETSGTTGRKRLTPVDVQQQVFRRAMFRGYNEQDVDDFLDEITEELTRLLEEQRQLRERAQAGATMPLQGAQDVSEATRMAEDIVRKARDEAAEILREARTQVAASGGGSSLGPFISQERSFLQELSRLIQSHADTVRSMAQARRGQATPAAAAPAPAPEPERREPAPPQVHEAPLIVPEEGADSSSVKELFYGED